MALPTFNDGTFTLYHIEESNDITVERTLVKDNRIENMWFQELSVSDRLRSQLEATNIDITMKIRIPQYRKIDSMSVLKIGDRYHKVYNAYHFKDDKSGMLLSDITLTNWEDNIA